MLRLPSKLFQSNQTKKLEGLQFVVINEMLQDRSFYCQYAFGKRAYQEYNILSIDQVEHLAWGRGS